MTQACHLAEQYWLYVVFDCASATPQLMRVQDPFNRLLANSVENARFAIAISEITEAAHEE